MSNPVLSSVNARHWLILLAIFIIALVPRWYSSQTVGWGWDGPDSFTLINYDEGGSCRAALEGFDYSTFIGQQTIAVASALGAGVPEGTVGDYNAARSYCYDPAHLNVARGYSAVLGAATVVLVGVMGFLLAPALPAVGFTAAALLAVSGFHISESQSGTVDAPSVFFIYLFFLAVLLALRSRRLALWSTPLLLVPAVWTKYWLFAFFAYACVVPQAAWHYVSQGFSARRLVLLVLALCILFGLLTNAAFQALPSWRFALLLPFYAVIPWQAIKRPMMLLWVMVPVFAWALTQVDLFAAYTTGVMEERFGTGYAAIGWNKWLRNPMNVGWVLLVGMGLPALLCLPAGVRAMMADRAHVRSWLVLLPVLVFALFMAFLAPVTYYRHYLALLPAALLLASLGYWQYRFAAKPFALAVFFLWPVALSVDLVGDYHQDPRQTLRHWYQESQPQRVYMAFYVAPPPAYAQSHALLQPEYAQGDAAQLRQAQYLVLSENWYDTAFPSELNGPYTSKLERLIKTKPEYARFYQQALAGEHPYLEPARRYTVSNFMPELMLHKALYGTFQMFVGDIVVLRITQVPRS